MRAVGQTREEMLKDARGQITLEEKKEALLLTAREDLLLLDIEEANIAVRRHRDIPEDDLDLHLDPVQMILGKCRILVEEGYP